MCGCADVRMCGSCPERSEWVRMCPDSYRDADVRKLKTKINIRMSYIQAKKGLSFGCYIRKAAYSHIRTLVNKLT
jgi:hypothetical protein